MNIEPNIVTLKWGTKFSPDYVNKLYYGFKRNTTIPFKFHCYTDDPTGLNPNIIPHSLPYEGIDGWWNKLYFFSSELDLHGRILFVDLDTLITGNVDHIISYNRGFVVLRDFFTGLAQGLTSNDNVQSSIVSFNAHQHTQIWESFIENPQRAVQSLHPHGDQKWIQKHQLDRLYWQDIFPNQLVSFKVHCRNGLPANARIVNYHGSPSIPESFSQVNKAQWWTIQPQKWVEDYWKD